LPLVRINNHIFCMISAKSFGLLEKINKNLSNQILVLVFIIASFHSRVGLMFLRIPLQIS
jgi:hypothetical protein